MVGIAVKASVGVTISVAVIIFYSFLLDVNLSDVLSIGLIGFTLTSIIQIVRLGAQGMRFHILVNIFGGDTKIRMRDNVLTRVASEFISLVSPSYFGGETIRVAWLRSKGVHVGRAAWTSFMELFLDVLLGSTISITVGLYTIFSGDYFSGSVILIIAVPVLTFFLVISWLSARRQVHVPRFVQDLLRRLFGTQRTVSITNTVESVGIMYSKAAKEFFTQTSRKLILLASLLTCSLVILGGLGLWTVFSLMGFDVNLMWAIAGFAVALTIGSIPISPGGAGLMEIGLSLITPLAVGSSAWIAIIVWRIIYYYVGIVISGVALSFLLFRFPRIYGKALNTSGPDKQTGE